MAQNLYCWRCDMVLPMLDEKEWEIIEPALRSAISDFQQHRKTHEDTLAEAMKHGVFGERALKLYQELTGFHETNVNALWHHRLSDYGPPCKKCEKPLRTPRARLCAACGAERD